MHTLTQMLCLHTYINKQLHLLSGFWGQRLPISKIYIRLAYITIQ